jgi:hypothetical protein
VIRSPMQQGRRRRKVALTPRLVLYVRSCCDATRIVLILPFRFDVDYVGCGNTFTVPAEHDFAACHGALIEQEAARWPAPFPPVETAK